MNFLSILLLLGAAVMARASDAIHVQPGKQLPQSLTVHSTEPGNEVTLRYLLFVPKGYKPEGKSWPLLLFLHGIGECSSDDLSRVIIHGPISRLFWFHRNCRRDPVTNRVSNIRRQKSRDFATMLGSRTS
jgi:predicted peptidase